MNQVTLKTQILAVKIDENGNQPDIAYYGGSEDDFGNSFAILPDKSIVIVGSTKSYSDDLTDDIYFIKIQNSLNNIIKDEPIGGDQNDYGNDIIVTKDKNLIIVGYSESEPNNNGEFDTYLAKIDTGANIIWEYNYGYKGSEEGNAVIQSSDDGYVFVGTTDFQKNKMIYMIKTKPNGVLEIE